MVNIDKIQIMFILLYYLFYVVLKSFFLYRYIRTLKNVRILVLLIYTSETEDRGE